MLESLGEAHKRKAEAIDICQLHLPLEPSILFCFWISNISGYLPWANWKHRSELPQHKMLSFGKWQLFLSKSPRMLCWREGVNLPSI